MHEKIKRILLFIAMIFVTLYEGYVENVQADAFGDLTFAIVKLLVK